jgi:hypothetical protein
LPYHSPHKFRHGHIQYGLANSKSIIDYEAVSMNVMHSSMEITDEFYSNLNDAQLQYRIAFLGKENIEGNTNQQVIDLFKQFLAWRKS